MAKKFVALMVGVLVSAMLVGSAIASDKVLVNGIDFGFPPFGFVDKDGKPAGFDVDAVNWIAKEMGFSVKHQPTDWDGIIPALNAGKIDFIASGMSATAERAKIVNFTIPYISVTQVILAKKGAAEGVDAYIKGGKTLGVQRGTVTAKLLDKLVKESGNDFTVKQYDSTDLSMQDLPIGRIDGSCMDSSIAAEMMKANSDYEVVATFDVAPENYAYAVRKADKELLETLNAGLKKLMADPYWKELKKKWDINY